LRKLKRCSSLPPPPYFFFTGWTSYGSRIFPLFFKNRAAPLSFRASTGFSSSSLFPSYSQRPFLFFFPLVGGIPAASSFSCCSGSQVLLSFLPFPPFRFPRRRRYRSSFFFFSYDTTLSLFLGASSLSIPLPLFRTQTFSCPLFLRLQRTTFFRTRKDGVYPPLLPSSQKIIRSSRPSSFPSFPIVGPHKRCPPPFVFGGNEVALSSPLFPPFSTWMTISAAFFFSQAWLQKLMLCLFFARQEEAQQSLPSSPFSFPA